MSGRICALSSRAGTDIAFLGGLINYAIANNRVAKEYLVNYTNAAFLIKDGFKLPDDGLFSGFDETTKTYDKSTWNYQQGGNETGKGVPAVAGEKPAQGNETKAAVMPVSATAKGTPGTPPPPPSLPPNVAYDLSLQHPRCVYQLLGQQYSRYTPEMVSRITGIPQDQLLKSYDLFTSIRKDGDMKKVATIIYAVGWTQHSFGTQIIRTAAMVQLLMGNVGRAGGGINALRGHSNIQGATDMAGIFFFFALLSGFGIYLPWIFRFFTPLFGGGAMTRLLHPWFGLGFVFFFSLQAFNWWQVMTWTPADSRWMKQIKQYVTRSDSAESPETGFFNAGQKMQFWEIVCGCIAYLITGVMMWFPTTFGRILVSLAYVIHDISALVMLFGIFFHVYLSTFGEPGTIQAMTRGTVSEAWAWTHHPAWYKEVTGRDPHQALNQAEAEMAAREPGAG